MARIARFSILKQSCRTHNIDCIPRLRQRYMAMEMAKEVSTGQAEVLRQCEQQSMAKTAQAGRLERVVSFANERIIHLEGMLGETKQHSEEATQLLAGSASAAYPLEGEAMKLRGVISKQEEEMQHASMVHADMKKDLGTVVRSECIIACTNCEHERGASP